MKKDRRRMFFSFVAIAAAVVIYIFYSMQEPAETYATTTTSRTTIATTTSTSTTSVPLPQEPEGFTIISPQNMAYSDGRIIVSIRASEVSRWIGEAVDSGTLVKECYDCLSFERYDMSFPPGIHVLTAYVEDRSGNVRTGRVVFTVLK